MIYYEMLISKYKSYLDSFSGVAAASFELKVWWSLWSVGRGNWSWGWWYRGSGGRCSARSTVIVYRPDPAFWVPPARWFGKRRI